jgi:hypothetical protein
MPDVRSFFDSLIAALLILKWTSGMLICNLWDDLREFLRRHYEKMRMLMIRKVV